VSYDTWKTTPPDMPSVPGPADDDERPEIPTGERECQDCHELAAASGDQMFETTFFCWRCWQRRILRTGEAIRRAKALETVEK